MDPPNRSDLLPGKPEHHSYQDLKILVDRLAGGLLELGLKKDDVLMYQAANTVEVVVVCLAAARLGIIMSPHPCSTVPTIKSDYAIGSAQSIHRGRQNQRF